MARTMTTEEEGRVTGPAAPLKPPTLPKRFYKEVAVGEADGLNVVKLDGRIVKTPGRAALGVADAAIADAMAAEWDAQVETINPTLMPITRIANTAIDAVSAKMDETRADIVAYAGNDLLCYRAESPESLAARQAEHWDPLLRWVADELNAPLRVAAGVLPIDQALESLEGFHNALGRFDPLGLAALHVATTLTGSAVLALAVAQRRLGPEEAWTAAHIDEDWQIAQWGAVTEAIERRQARWRDMAAASMILDKS